MNKLQFDDKFDTDVLDNILFNAYDGASRILCLVPSELLHDEYGADRLGVKQAFLQSRHNIRMLAQELYEELGAPDGQLRIYRDDL